MRTAASIQLSAINVKARMSASDCSVFMRLASVAIRSRSKPEP